MSLLTLFHFSLTLFLSNLLPSRSPYTHIIFNTMITTLFEYGCFLLFISLSLYYGFHGCAYIYRYFFVTTEKVLQRYQAKSKVRTHVILTGGTSDLGIELTKLLLRDTDFMIVRIQRCETAADLYMGRDVAERRRLCVIPYNGELPIDDQIKTKLVDLNLTLVPITMIFHVIGVVPRNETISRSQLWTINYLNVRAIDDFFVPLMNATSYNNQSANIARVYVSSIISSFPSLMLKDYSNTKAALEHYTSASRSQLRILGSFNKTIISVLKPGVFSSKSTIAETQKEALVPSWLICTPKEVAHEAIIHLQNDNYHGHWRHIVTHCLFTIFIYSTQFGWFIRSILRA